ncbi:hypothetical protein ACEPAI_1858 [Sanghuangporus weigelae]
MEISGKIKCAVCGHVCQDRKGLAIHLSTCKEKKISSDRPGRANRLKSLKQFSRTQQRAVEDELDLFPVLEDLGQEDFAMDFEEYTAVAAAADAPADLRPPPLLDAPPELPAGSKRQRKLPMKFKDHMPSCSTSRVLPAVSLPHLLDHVPAPEVWPPAPPPPPLPPPPPVAPSPPVPVYESFRTVPNSFGAFRVYPRKPDDDPDSCLDLDDLCDFRPVARNHPSPSLPPVVKNVYAPFKNASVFLLICWMNRENKMKTYEEVDRLVHDVLLHPDFDIQDLRNFVAKCEHDRFDLYIKSPADQNNTKSMDGWREGSVKIKLPPEDGKRRAEGKAEAPEFEVGSINYRPILETVYKALDNPEASAFHYTPYQELWKPDYLSEAERIYGELYSSDIWLESHEEIQRLPRINEVDNFVLPILLYSDSTHLTKFGSASLWPLYMFLGGHSKYLRCKSAESTCNHLAYIPSLPHNIQDVYKRHYGRAASSQALTHLRRKLMQAVLSLAVLQPDFLNAYENGFLFLCCDGVHRRLFPRIMVYSADYPERMLVASLKTMGAFPCASCEIPNKFIHMLGTRADEQRKAHKCIDNEAKQDKVENARRWIFESGYRLDSARVKDCLGPYSLIPTRNAFSSLSKFGFKFHNMFTPDLLHEFELGVWKRIFIHLIRIIVAEGGDLISTLNTW